jgi:hypothetical protein
MMLFRDHDLREENAKVYLDFEDEAEELEAWAGPFAVEVSRQSPHFSSSLYSLWVC